MTSAETKVEMAWNQPGGWCSGALIFDIASDEIEGVVEQRHQALPHGRVVVAVPVGPRRPASDGVAP